MRNILFTVLFIGILSLIASPISLASKSLHKANMINLSNNAIICMHQDPDGYLWIGTYDGLNLYNGKDTYVYRFELNNKNLKSATKLFSVLLASKRPLITELADKLRLKYPLLPTISPCPTMRLEAIRSIIPISCRRYPKSV